MQLPPSFQEAVRLAARQRAIKDGLIRLPNKSEEGAVKPVVDRPKVVLSDLYIRDKFKRVVRFEPNEVQTGYLDKIVPRWRSEDYKMEGLREIILKSRRFGYSTLILALFYLDTVNEPNTETVLMAHDAESTEKLFRVVHLFHERLPDHKRPVVKSQNRREIVYPEINSTFRVMTAGTETSGRSSTLNNLHCSEIAFWPSSDILTGLLQAVTPGGNVFEELTANGEGYVETGSDGVEIITGSHFHIHFKRAWTGVGEFKAQFFAWFEHSEYRKELPEEFELITVGSDAQKLMRYDDEAELMRLYAIDKEQIYWRRCKIDEQGMGPSKFKQEYPATHLEPFATSGQRFFDNWNDMVHTCMPFEIPAHWVRLSGFDWGFGAPYCYLTGAIDPYENVYITHEQYQAGVTNPVMAAQVKELALLTDCFDDPVWADQSIWSGKTQADGSVVADVDAFLDVGLCMVKAIKNDRHAWANFRAFLYNTVATPVDMTEERWWDKPGRSHSVVVFKPDGSGAGCPNLIMMMPQMKRDPLKPEKMLEIFNRRPVADHAPATASYLLSSFILAADEANANPVKTREQILRDAGACQDRVGNQNREMWG